VPAPVDGPGRRRFRPSRGGLTSEERKEPVELRRVSLREEVCTFQPVSARDQTTRAGVDLDEPPLRHISTLPGPVQTRTHSSRDTACTVGL
jgi:hypothetical protein